MKIVVIGGNGFIGSRLVDVLRGKGQQVVAASPRSGVDSLTGAGLAEALAGARVVVDVTNSPTFEAAAALRFFESSSRNLLAAGVAAGVRHHVALSIVGTDRLQGSGYFRGKLAQERLVEASGIPYTILRSTQFFEFLGRIADSFTDGTTVRAPSALIQPVLAHEVVDVLAEIAHGALANGTLDFAGPERFRIDEILRRVLAIKGDSRTVITDPTARYFGAALSDESLVPGQGARIAMTRVDDWLDQAAVA